MERFIDFYERDVIFHKHGIVFLVNYYPFNISDLASDRIAGD